MKKIFRIMFVILLLVTTVLPVSAANGKVTYDGRAKEIIFEPGSTHSLTDLFPNYKDVMPGDSLKQEIAVKNAASDKVKVKIYMRALGSHEDSGAFLSQLGLRVKKSADNEMAYMFDATAEKTAQLTDWVCLGTLYSGGEVNLEVFLDVPTSLDNMYSSQIGYLDWQFMIEEFPIDDDDPKVPQTGDDMDSILWGLVATVAIVTIFVLLYRRRR